MSAVKWVVAAGRGGSERTATKDGTTTRDRARFVSLLQPLFQSNYPHIRQVHTQLKDTRRVNYSSQPETVQRLSDI